MLKEYKKPLNSKENMIIESNIQYNKYVKVKDNTNYIYLFVEGIHCGACVWLIENSIKKLQGVQNARVNLTTKSLKIEWIGEKDKIYEITDLVHKLGYKLIPYDEYDPKLTKKSALKDIIKRIAVAGFGLGQVMMLAMGIWFSNDIDPYSKQYLHIIMSIVSIPILIYSSMPFFRSGFMALSSSKTGNMDTAISIGIISTILISLQETIRNGQYTYYDSGLMLVFILLISRYIDTSMRAKTYEYATHMLMNVPKSATIMSDDGKLLLVRADELKIGDKVFVASGEQIPADGIIASPEGLMDLSLINGESVPASVKEGAQVYAGTINVGQAIYIVVQKLLDNSLIAEIIALIENAKQSKDKFVVLADKVAKIYTPFALFASLCTFALYAALGMQLMDAILRAISVLLITCPCAMALAVPAVQIIATGRLMALGVMIKTSDAFERIYQIKSVIFDKTGTLTIGLPDIINSKDFTQEEMGIIYNIAVKSKHPLCKAIAAKWSETGSKTEITDVSEYNGLGMTGSYKGQQISIGRSDFCHIKDEAKISDIYQEIWVNFGKYHKRIIFIDQIKSDAHEAISAIKKLGLKVVILSGDKELAVENVAKKLEISTYLFGLTPKDKYDYIVSLPGKALMVGDGMNDAAAAKAAHISICPATGMGITLSNSDIVLMRNQLMPIVEIIKTSRVAAKIAKQNIAMSVIYNAVAIPAAIIGLVTPVFAAIAMSLSSICVILNSLRAKR